MGQQKAKQPTRACELRAVALRSRYLGTENENPTRGTVLRNRTCGLSGGQSRWRRKRVVGMGIKTGNRKIKSRYDINMSKGENNLGGLFKEIDHLIEQATKSKKKNRSEFSRTGEIKGLASKRVRVLYGFSIKLGQPARQ